ncbi:major facilitator superfamily domain-containing protein [Gymnopilus junonius]|uniref:Major facilitator superfamily domain-containing protein n=1 Tax=Gymnopilus junonius TaxID=109634 RepID=A0A9P5NDS2_GYMJU|nr:major facilitator superfamily domain-containing protein [Gymnopilus junonius]
MTPNDSEETPLLQPSKHEDLYKRFKPAQKRWILAIVSATGLLPLFVSGTFIPSIPQIAKDLDSTASIISLAVSLSVFASSIGSLSGASYSTFYGRKPVYLVGTPLLLAGSLGVAASQTVPELMVWRFIQALGASPGLAVGSGVIGDIYKLEERGQALGIFFSAILLGPAIAPFAGGFAAHYFSWRLMQAWLGGAGFLIFFIVLFFFPETYHPGERGVDKVDPATLPTWRPIFINPLKALWILRSPNLLAVAMAGFATLLTDYVLLVPLAYTIGVKYGITNEMLIGACFLPCGLGNMVGSPLAGRLSDKVVIYYRKKRGGEWYPEDRLRATILGGVFLIPLSVFGSGLLTGYVPGKVGLVLNLVCLFMNGVGVDFVLSPSAAYFVDLMHSRSAEAMAANNGFRSVIMALAIAGIFPMVETFGVVITNTLAALFALAGFGLIWLTIQYGERLRTVVDVGFSTADNN